MAWVVQMVLVEMTDVQPKQEKSFKMLHYPLKKTLELEKYLCVNEITGRKDCSQKH